MWNRLVLNFVGTKGGSGQNNSRSAVKFLLLENLLEWRSHKCEAVKTSKHKDVLQFKRKGLLDVGSDTNCGYEPGC